MKKAVEKNDLKKQGFYQSKAWRRLRVQALQRDHYLCQACLRGRRIKKATEVHHIKPVDEHPELALELSNLTSLCWDCHELTKHRPKQSAAIGKARIIEIGGDGDPEA